ncbi:MAG: hypothetical protein LBM99_06180, partial [Bacillales bacterium]|nr:hypothetical protein [Bacillales bacterium]
MKNNNYKKPYKPVYTPKPVNNVKEFIYSDDVSLQDLAKSIQRSVSEISKVLFVKGQMFKPTDILSDEAILDIC